MRQTPELCAPRRVKVEEPHLLAQLNLLHFRALELAWLRWGAICSMPLWLQMARHSLPGWLAWLAFLAQGLGLALVVGFGVLERTWSRRAARTALGPIGVVVETPWTAWHELRSAVWHAFALVSVVPWISTGLDRPLPPPVVSGVGADAWAVLLLLATAETLAASQPGRRVQSFY